MQDYLDAQLPFEAFVTYSQVDYVYGYWAAEFWKCWAYENSPQMAREFYSKGDVAREQIQRAFDRRFAIPQDYSRDVRIRNRYIILRKGYADLERRMQASERWKDFFAYFGVASMFGIAAIVASKMNKPESNYL